MTESSSAPVRSGPPRLGLLATLAFKIILFIYHRHKFTTVGTPPSEHRFVIIAVPHTSNWDFPNYIGLTRDFGLNTHFMAKTSLFRWPMAKFMREVGGVPVVRSASRDMVQQMVDQFAKRDEFVLTVAPEGTRKSVDAWRTGFYQIALGAGVPIVCGFMDYENKRGGIGPVITPTGDYETDMAPAFAFYKNIKGRRGGVSGLSKDERTGDS